MVNHVPKLSKVVHNFTKLSKMFANVYKWSQNAQIVKTLQPFFKYCKTCSKIALNGLKCKKKKICQNGPKMVQHGPSWSKMVVNIFFNGSGKTKSTGLVLILLILDQSKTCPFYAPSS